MPVVMGPIDGSPKPSGMLSRASMMRSPTSCRAR